MSFARRQLRLRVLETLARRSKAFRTRHDIWPLRTPADPVPLDEVVEEALGDEARAFDVRDLKVRSLMTMEWEGEAGEVRSRWELWVVAQPSGVNLYCDTSGFPGDPEGETRILASGKRDAQGGEVDEFFLELLTSSAGQHFGIEMSGGAPSIVRTSITNREFLIDLFVDLFELTHEEASVRAAVHDPRLPRSDDFRIDVERWLSAAIRQ